MSRAVPHGWPGVARPALTALTLTASPGGAAGPAIVTFPGPVRSAPAPDGTGARIFYRPHLDHDGAQAHPLFFADARGRPVRIGTVTRSVGVGWAPDGRRAFVQDNLGSNVADCYVLARTRRGIAGISLFRRIQRTAGRPHGTEAPGASHYYVRCLGWRTPDVVAGSVDGHTDSAPSHAFHHPFAFDARAHRVRWLHRGNRTGDTSPSSRKAPLT